MSFLSEPKLVTKKAPLRHDYDYPTCHTCKSLIDDSIYRFIVINDKGMNKETLSFHYFFPCWDVDYVCSSLENYEICKAGFNCDESVLKNPKIVNNLRKNHDLWDI